MKYLIQGYQIKAKQESISQLIGQVTRLLFKSDSSRNYAAVCIAMHV